MAAAQVSIRQHYKTHRDAMLASNKKYYELNREDILAKQRIRQKARREAIKNIDPCYFKEANAILTDKHWKGKNRCVKLPGDEDQ